MKKIRQHNDIDISVVIKNTEGEILDPSLCKGIQIRVQTNGNETQIAHYDIFEDGHIVFRFNAKDQTQIGVYDIVISATTTDGRVFTTDVCKAFCIVPCTCCTDNEPGEVETETLEVEATIEITSWGYMYDKRVEAIEEKLERLDDRDEKLQEQIDSNHTELGEAFEGLYDDMEKNYSKKSNTIRHITLSPDASANGLSLLLEGEYDDSVQGSHLLGPHNIILPYATESKAGVMSPEDKKAIVENKNTIEDKQDAISDLEEIRQGAAKGMTALQEDFIDLGDMSPAEIISKLEDNTTGIFLVRDNTSGSADIRYTIYKTFVPSSSYSFFTTKLEWKGGELVNTVGTFGGDKNGHGGFIPTTAPVTVKADGLMPKSMLGDKVDTKNLGNYVEIKHNYNESYLLIPKATSEIAGVMTPEDKKAIVENKNTIEDKQDAISDLEEIRQGAAKGMTALQEDFIDLGDMSPAEIISKLEDNTTGIFLVRDNTSGSADIRYTIYKTFVPSSSYSFFTTKLEWKGGERVNTVGAFGGDKNGHGGFIPTTAPVTVKADGLMPKSMLGDKVDTKNLGNYVEIKHNYNESYLLIPKATSEIAGVMTPEDKKAIVENKNTIEDKQDAISDLEEIRQGAAKGMTALQEDFIDLGDMSPAEIISKLEDNTTGIFLVRDNTSGSADIRYTIYKTFVPSSSYSFFTTKLEWKGGERVNTVGAFGGDKNGHGGFTPTLPEPQAVSYTSINLSGWMSDTVFVVSNAISTLTVTINAPTDGVPKKEYAIHFSTSNSIGTFSFPDNLLWANGNAPTIEANTVYELSIVSTLVGGSYIHKGVLTAFK